MKQPYPAFPTRRLAIGVAAFVLGIPLLTQADLVRDFTAQEESLNRSAEQARTLADELAILDAQATLKQQRVTAAEAEAAAARTKLATLNGSLTRLNQERVAALRKLTRYVRMDYLEQVPDEYAVIGSEGSLRQNLALMTYFGGFERSANGARQEAAGKLAQMDDRRRDAIRTADRLTEAEETAQRESAELAAVRTAKTTLLSQTQGQEDAFRRQYELLRAQLEATGAFARTARDRVASRVWDDSGFYFNQLDSRWIDAKLGFSPTSTIGDYGCAVASLAMVHKYHGMPTTPPELNGKLRNVGAFVDDLMDWRNAAAASDGRLQLATAPYPVGKAHVRWEEIDSLLAEGSPVIVYVDRPGQINHYVTLLEKRGSGYLMHDPIEGPYLDFHRYYSSGMVIQAIGFRKA